MDDTLAYARTSSTVDSSIKLISRVPTHTHTHQYMCTLQIEDILLILSNGGHCQKSNGTYRCEDITHESFFLRFTNVNVYILAFWEMFLGVVHDFLVLMGGGAGRPKV